MSSSRLLHFNVSDIDTWLLVQSHVDSFTHSATKCARRMATFVKILNKEDISLVKNRDSVRQVRLLQGIFFQYLIEFVNLEDS